MTPSSHDSPTLEVAEPAREIALLVLAAGRGARLGGVAKALLTGGDGQTFLETIVERAAAIAVRRGVVVVGPPFGDQVADHGRALGLDVVCNPAPERGMSSSVALGATALIERFPVASATLLWPVDHPMSSPATIAAIAMRAAAGVAVVPIHGGRGGHPIAVGRALWPELAKCDLLPEGARSVLRKDHSRVVRFEVDDPTILADFDTPADLARR